MEYRRIEIGIPAGLARDGALQISVGCVPQHQWLVSLRAALEVSDHKWIQATDEVVLEHLRAELARLQGASTPLEALGCSDPGQVRETFLALTKVYHPNRFARRPREIRSLANEVYLAVKKAYDKGKGEAAAHALKQTRAKLESDKQERIQQRSQERRATPSSRPPVQSAERKELQDRRREQLRNRLGGSAASVPPRTAQIRAATSRKISESNTPDTQEADFAKAVAIMEAGDFEAAARAFKAVAVSRPSEKRYRLHMHYAQGKVFQQNKQIDEARAEYKRCLGLDSTFVLAHEAISSLPKEGKRKSSFMSKIFGK